jgi:hypothetical protein
MSGAYAAHAAALEMAGYQPIPISLPNPRDPDGGKRPVVERDWDWTRYRPVAERLPRFGIYGVGLLTATIPAVDIDVLDADLADALDRIIVGELGDAPLRYGRAPKRVRLYRAEELFTKVSTRAFRLPGDDPASKGHRVEVLADGQQFVAFGVHPGTGLPYFWPDASPLDLERDDLPEITPESARHIVAEAERILIRAGGVPITRRGPQTANAAEWVEGPAPRGCHDLAEARRVVKALRSIDPSTLDRETWISVGYGLKAALGEHGRGLWLTWSARSAKHGLSGRSATPEIMWRRIRPQRCGWRFLERLAGAIARG